MTPQQLKAMKLALGALEDSPMSRKNKDAIDALRETLAQPEQALCDLAEDGVCETLDCPNHPIEQEPVAWQWLGSAHFRKKLPKNADITAWNPLYTHSPQRKPLTNGEIYTAYITATNQTLRATDERLAFAFARAIEAAHDIKE
jgi:hypothetical protein